MKDLNQNTFDSFEINPNPWIAGCETVKNENGKENDPKVIRPPQSIKLLSTAKNIPRSAFDLPNISNSDRVVQCSKMPPFSENLIKQPEIAFMTLQNDDVSDSRYAKWLKKQIRNPESVENLATRPLHLKSIASDSNTPRGKLHFIRFLVYFAGFMLFSNIKFYFFLSKLFRCAIFAFLCLLFAPQFLYRYTLF